MVSEPQLSNCPQSGLHRSVSGWEHRDDSDERSIRVFIAVIAVESNRGVASEQCDVLCVHLDVESSGTGNSSPSVQHGRTNEFHKIITN